ncbi:MAG: LacI family DNA-binding transcriptional regulator [Acidobacteriota bacterium]
MTKKDIISVKKAKRVTAQDIARHLGVSIMTVSRAMNNRGYVDERTRERVLAAAKELGYRPNYIAKSLALNKTQTIGVIVPEITHSFFPEAIRGIEEAAFMAGYQLILTHSAENERRERDALMTLESKRVDGILISTAQSVESAMPYKKLVDLGIPIVFFDRCMPGIGASCVSIDDEESAKQITLHLLGHGYKRIAHLSGPVRVSIGRSRLNGFREALCQKKVTVFEELIVESGFHESGGYEAMKTLLALPKKQRPRAVVAVNDPAAFGAMRAIEESGLSIPKDIAIVGFSDDIRAALVSPPLTTVRQPAYEVGKLAAQKLIEQIEKRTAVIDEITVHTEQVIRSSCGCTPHRRQNRP